MEMRSRRDQDDVHTAGQQLLVGVEADKAMVVRDFDLVGPGLFELLATRLEALVENIGQGNEADVLAGAQRIAGGFGAASATADETDADDVTASRVDATFQGEMAQRGGAGKGGGGFKKIAARAGPGVGGWVRFHLWQGLVGRNSHTIFGNEGCARAGVNDRDARRRGQPQSTIPTLEFFMVAACLVDLIPAARFWLHRSSRGVCVAGAGVALDLHAG
jgi:hypothetical protein